VDSVPNESATPGKGVGGRDEEYDVGPVVERLRGRTPSRRTPPLSTNETREFPPTGGIADRVGRVTREHDPSVLFLGSDDGGRVVTSLMSVAAPLASEGPSRESNLTPTSTTSAAPIADRGSDRSIPLLQPRSSSRRSFRREVRTHPQFYTVVRRHSLTVT
jgi:hypothetical protein